MNGIPQNCKEEHVERICDYCPLNNFYITGHPGGSPYHTVESHYCEEGFWEDNL